MRNILRVLRFIHSIRNYILGIGLIITFLACFFPLFTSCTPGEYDYIQSEVIGYMSFTYLLGIFFLAILILLVKILRYKSGTTVWVLSVIFIAIIQGYTKIGTAGFGRPCGNNPTAYLHYAHVGNLLVVFWAILTSMRNQLSPKVKNSSVLLDDQMIEH